MPIHTDFRRGQTIRVMFKDRRPHVIAQFMMTKGACLHLDDRRRKIKIPLADVRATTIERATQEGSNDGQF